LGGAAGNAKDFVLGFLISMRAIEKVPDGY